jgi:hypothetical protein
MTVVAIEPVEPQQIAALVFHVQIVSKAEGHQHVGGLVALEP